MVRASAADAFVEDPEQCTYFAPQWRAQGEAGTIWLRLDGVMHSLFRDHKTGKLYRSTATASPCPKPPERRRKLTLGGADVAPPAAGKRWVLREAGRDDAEVCHHLEACLLNAHAADFPHWGMNKVLWEVWGLRPEDMQPQARIHEWKGGAGIAGNLRNRETFVVLICDNARRVHVEGAGSRGIPCPVAMLMYAKAAKYPEFPAHKEWHVFELSVRKEYRHKGLGELLLRYVTDHLHPGEPFGLFAHSNLHGDVRLPFYKKCGFVHQLVEKKKDGGVWRHLRNHSWPNETVLL